MDFASVNTDKLALETREKARGVWDVTDAAWDAAGVAFIATVTAGIPTIFILAFAVMTHPAMLVLLVAIWPLFEDARKADRNWRKCLKRCADFTAELEARNAELRKRAA